MEPLLSIQGLTVAFPRAGRWIPVVRDLSLDIRAGEFVGLVGESGSGKSIAALATLRLVPPPGKIRGGRVLVEGEDLGGLSESEMRGIRGAKVSMIFQEPATALNPVFTIGFQIVEAIRIHHRVKRREARQEAQRLLELVAIPDAAQRLEDYPHQLSGGQKQRAMIAMALAARPALLIADEPTTALDVTIQAQILELLDRLRGELGLAVLLITHDLAVVAETCERVVVMYAGESVEEAQVNGLFENPSHPYTRGLLAALPRLRLETGDPPRRLEPIPGRVADPADLPLGCVFHPRCPDVFEPCSLRSPDVVRVGPEHSARCFLHDQVSAEAVENR
ncbi:MAG: ABC transporter ATP-binding protein [Acidobacteriota bacterium]|nr:ABC transporter ATP-binding protein [Acidobacteriota bacterium]